MYNQFDIKLYNIYVLILSHFYDYYFEYHYIFTCHGFRLTLIYKLFYLNLLLLLNFFFKRIYRRVSIIISIIINDNNGIKTFYLIIYLFFDIYIMLHFGSCLLSAFLDPNDV